ncbi:MAG: PEP-CTERM system histidine kinase PrsK [Ectothiorhodospiraceae bacterium]|nr:PEP-CTERM system histidine kinase PrsK [Ectothiorhodospiraceae bacterium]
MTAFQLSAISYALAAGAYALLAVLLVTTWRGRLSGGLLVLATAATAIWGGASATYSLWRMPPFSALQLLEVLRDVTWFLFLLQLLSPGTGFLRLAGSVRLMGVLLGGLATAVCVVILADRYAAPLQGFEAWSGQLAVLGRVLLTVGGLALVEQLFRSTSPERRWSVKYLCFGVGGLFAYDLFLYAKALLFQSIDGELWAARGVITAMVVPLIAVSAARNPQWTLDIFVSRHVLFHSVAVLGAGVYLVLMAAAGYWIRAYGGTWGGIAQAGFLFGAMILLAVVAMSGQVRSRTKVFLSKHFYKNRYDYREEWLKFTQTLSSADEEADLGTRIVRAVAEMVESPGGGLWLRQGAGGFVCGQVWGFTPPAGAVEAADSSLARFLARDGWVVLVDEYRERPEAYPGLEIPEWLAETPRAWLVVPLMHGDELVAFIVLQRSPTKTSLNWEDTDLLKTVGRQAASYLALWLATEALTEARQFEAFNRLSAFVVHDLKNIVAQLALVVSNSKRHRGSPEFVDDAFDTIENATGRMNRMLAQLRKGRAEPGAVRATPMAEVLERVVRARGVGLPRPMLVVDSPEATVRVDADRLASVVEHLVQNAQEATADDGTVTVRLRTEADRAVVEIIDSGVGMDADFISQRLFRPFDTTKGNAGMGVGVYQSREFVQSAGGDIDVTSAPGAGTTFTIRLPMSSGDLDSPRAEQLELAS